ncbi:MAG: nucleotide-diphospho-sugar transferase [Sphingobacteriaceae bacterium]|nr:MAG: nucleotide-diphospho-sugar transferase [Sphingobacteriaceae bacterium]
MFETIRVAKPKKLFVSADGPRMNKEGEAAKCEEVRRFILDSIDWDCEVQTLFREKNMGSGPAVSDAITWFFSNVEYGIILEDDCLPNNSFFGYADKVLNLYKENEQIMHVSGCNSQCGIKRGDASYYFSKIPATWGWATWRRAWEKYSFSFFKDSDEAIIKVLEQTIKNPMDVDYFFNEIQSTKNKLVSAWDYQWFYTLLKYNAICITPKFNLIENIGFNAGGTHTLAPPYWYRYLVSKSLIPFVLADKVQVNKEADSFYFALTMGRRTLETTYVKSLYHLRRLLKIK